MSCVHKNFVWDIKDESSVWIESRNWRKFRKNTKTRHIYASYCSTKFHSSLTIWISSSAYWSGIGRI